MKIKTPELIGVALDWAVAEAGNHRVYVGRSRTTAGTQINDAELVDMCVDGNVTYSPSTDWAQGGPIIEREGYAIRKYGDFAETRWQADDWQFRFANPKAVGPTPLIAVMRCYVASKLGDEVEVPDQLTS